MDLLQALINNGNDKAAAKDIIREIKERMMEGEDPEELLYEQGLEPDYVMDLLF